MANARGAKRAAYQKAYNARPAEIKRRAARNAARAKLMKAGKVRKGDGRDVDHRAPLSRGGGNGAANLRVQGQRANRGWRKGKSGYRA